MIEVGKVVTRETMNYPRSAMMSGFGHELPTVSLATPTEWATVQVGIEGVAVALHRSGTSGDLKMTPEKAIELAQMMMKAAECQAEYAKSRRELQDEMVKLDEAFKDRISGLGIDGIKEPEGKLAPIRRDGEVIIVDAG